MEVEVDFPTFKGKGKAKDNQLQDNEALPWCVSCFKELIELIMS